MQRRSAQQEEARPPEIQRAQLGEAEADLLETLERPAAELPHRRAVDAIVDQREPRALQRVQVPPDRALMDFPQRRELGDRNPRPCGVDLTKDLPLAYELGVARHDACPPY